MNTRIAAPISLVLGMLSATAAAQCESLPSGDTDVLVSLLSSSDVNGLLQVDFDEGTVCSLERDAAGLDAQSSAAVRLNAEAQELVVEAEVDGTALWLRIDSSSSQALILDRETSEDLGLTAAEFLGDNSLLEASDFFIEFVDSVQIGGYVLRDVEASIPRLDMPYDHYADRGFDSAAVRTVGTIGEESLEHLRITLDVANNRIYISEAR